MVFTRTDGQTQSDSVYLPHEVTFILDMIVLADKRIPAQAIKKLKSFAKVVWIETDGLVYDAISGHPDIFFSAFNHQLILAPNLPETIKGHLSDLSIPFIEGQSPVGSHYPETAKYNCVITDRYVIHNLQLTDSGILNTYAHHTKINIKQGYTRCNLLPLKNDHFISSDRGIYQSFQQLGLNILYVNPFDIVLPGFQYGFIGGACGIYEDKIYILGKLNTFQDGEKMQTYLENLDYEIIELYDGPLFDGGSLLFI